MSLVAMVAYRWSRHNEWCRSNQNSDQQDENKLRTHKSPYDVCLWIPTWLNRCEWRVSRMEVTVLQFTVLNTNFSFRHVGNSPVATALFAKNVAQGRYALPQLGLLGVCNPRHCHPRAKM
jgi:hypothetical protein